MSDLSEVVADAVRAGVLDAQVEVTVDGNRALIQVQSPELEGISRVNQQRKVYACISHLISDGTLHAVTIRASG